MRLIFAGTPAAAVPSLDALTRAGHELAAVLTRPDAAVGRKRILTPSPVALRADGLGLPVLRIGKPDEGTAEQLRELQADLGVVVAYGAILRPAMLAAPRLGWVNLHFSLLPRWRGAAPVQHAIFAGDATTGVSVFQLDAGMDTGPVYGSRERPIDPADTAASLLDALAVDGAGLLADVVGRLESGRAHAVPQSGEPTLAPKLALEDGRIDVTAGARRVLDRVRGATPEPGARLLLEGGAVLKVHAAAPVEDGAALPAGAVVLRGRRLLLGTASEPVELVAVQPPGGRRMSGADWWRGLPAGTAAVVAEEAS